MRALAVLAVLLLAGCTDAGPLGGTTPAEPTVYVGPPADGGGPAPCAPQSARQYPVDVRGVATRDDRGLGVGLHRLNESSWLWVWASYHDTDRQDRVSRVNEAQVFAEGGQTWLCTRVELVAPTFVDGARSSYAVAVQYDVLAPLPAGSVHWTVDWVAGCARCDPLPAGNTTATFE